MENLTKEQKVLDIIKLCKDMDIDGETTEYILTKIGMQEQILRQLFLNSNWDNINNLLFEKKEL